MHTESSGMNTSLLQLPMTNRYTINTLALLPGTRCYVDASTLPDHPTMPPRQAGLGILIVNVQAQPTQTIYIHAKLAECTSVLMAEAVSLAFAATVAETLNLSNINFLSDCQQLVHFLNAADQSNPPDWRIKPFTQMFSNYARSRESKIFKIKRQLNTTADALARQALSVSASQYSSLEPTCSYEHHVLQCSLLQALQAVDLDNVTIISARCC